MADPKRPKVIAITVTSGVTGQPITIRNRNNGDTITTTLVATAGTGRGATVDLQNFTNGYTAGHVIDFIVGGEAAGSNSLTTSGTKGEKVTVSTTAPPAVARGI